MALPRQRSANAMRIVQLPEAGTSVNSKGHPNRRDLVRVVETKMRELEEQARRVEDGLRSGEVDVDDLAD